MRHVTLMTAVSALVLLAACTPKVYTACSEGRGCLDFGTSGSEVDGPVNNIVGQFDSLGKFHPIAASNSAPNYVPVLNTAISAAAFPFAGAFRTPDSYNSSTVLNNGIAEGAVKTGDTKVKTGDTKVKTGDTKQTVGPTTLTADQKTGDTNLKTGDVNTSLKTGDVKTDVKTGDQKTDVTALSKSSSDSRLKSNIVDVNYQQQYQLQNQTTMIDNKNLGNGDKCPGMSCDHKVHEHKEKCPGVKCS
jgi:hypothetical protein